MLQPHEITAVAIRAAFEAGKIALEGFRSAETVAEIKTDKHDLVTQYDRACEQHIRQLVLAHYPDSSIVGEEDGSRIGTGELTWYIDPIDGTSNYARGIAMWAVSIGVARRGEMMTGVIYDPVSDHMFWADARGAFLSNGALDGEPLPLHSRGYTQPEQATVALNFPLARDLVHRPQLALEQFAAVTQTFAQVRSLGSTCIALAWIAAGWLDTTISFETNSWDIAAGSLLIKRAGGVFETYDHDARQLPQGRDYLGDHYFATVAGGQFELLREIMRTQSARGLAE
jgi:myo-inositol-1(or 4)-monophosphatase